MTETSAEIFEFPIKNKRKQYPSTFEDFVKKENEFEIMTAEDIAITGLEDFLSMIASRGIEIDPSVVKNDVLLVLDSMRSLQFRIQGIEHDLHEFADLKYEGTDYEYPEYGEFGEYEDSDEDV
jgi:hypothetical protein